MSTALKNVAITGASGSVGSVVLQKLIDDGRFNITVLKRNSSKSTFPASVKTVGVDFNSVESLSAALKGQDAFVSTVGSEGLDEQKILVDAAVAAGVKRFIPSEYGCDLENPLARKLPVFGYKVALEDILAEKAKTTDLSYTLLYSGPFLDWGLKHDFVLALSNYKPAIFDSGDNVFSTSTLDAVATAIVGTLLKPEETKNRALRFQSTHTTQNKLLALAKKAAPGKDWQPQPTNLDEVVAKADARLAKHLFDNETFVPYIFRAIFTAGYGSQFQALDNDLLGVKQLTDDELFEVVKQEIKN